VFKGIWLRGTVVVALLVCAGFSVTACGGSSGPSQSEQIAQARREGEKLRAEKVKEHSLEHKLEKLERENAQEKKQLKEKERHEKKQAEEAHTPLTPAPSPSAPEPSPPSGTDCGDGVIAGPETSCGFALNTAAEYEAQIGSGSGTIEAYSEANEEVYSMFCTAAPHECSGAISATVFFP
jgi:hypothetical protein